MKKTILLLILVISTLSAWDTAKVTYVEDGDTLWILKEGKSIKTRLIGLDTFETKMNHRVFLQLSTLKNIHPNKNHSVKEVLAIGHKTKKWVKNRVLSKTVQYHSYGLDKYNRQLIYVKDLNYLLIRNGMAIQYPTNKMNKTRKSFLLEASREANKERKGIYAKDK